MCFSPPWKCVVLSTERKERDCIENWIFRLLEKTSCQRRESSKIRWLFLSAVTAEHIGG